MRIVRFRTRSVSIRRRSRLSDASSPTFRSAVGLLVGLVILWIGHLRAARCSRSHEYKQRWLDYRLVGGTPGLLSGIF